MLIFRDFLGDLLLLKHELLGLSIVTLTLLINDGDVVSLDVTIGRNVGEVVIQVPMASLISAHMSDHVSEGGIRGQVVILDGLLGCLHALPVGKVALVDLLKQHCVRVNCLFLQVANESMAVGGRQKICNEVGIEEDSLRRSNHQAIQDAWVPQLQEKEQVHALVLSLLEQMVDPAMVAFQSP